MEYLIVLLLVGAFVGPTAYRFYERLKSRRTGLAEPPPGPSWGRRMLGMLVPVFLLAVFLIVLYVAIHYLAYR